MRKFLIVILILSVFLSGIGATEHVVNDDWAYDVRVAINDFIDMYGNKSDNYSARSYVVSDFDNSASIFDVCEQFIVYQAEVMGYGFTPEELRTVLSSGLINLDEDLSEYGYGKGSYNDWIEDITTAYKYLYKHYGPFTPDGVDLELSKQIQKDPMWAEFTAKIINLYSLICDKDSAYVAYPWITYLYTGMTENEVYNLAKASHAKYKEVATSEKVIRTSDSIKSKVGVTECTYTEGIQVTENIKELWQKLDEAGIDIWVCTASDCDIIRAAVDEFGLHAYCTGIIGMTPAVEDGKIICSYDYETGYALYAENDGSWSKGNIASRSQTQGIGKVISIQNICKKLYGCGPLAGFMDSTGDYNFCTEFESLKLVICFNRADRKVTDGGSVIAELAMYQHDNLGYDLKKANAEGDTLYVLQGRDENGTRTLRNSNKTIKYGDTEERLYRNEQNFAVYDYIVANNMTTEDVINTFAIKTDSESASNVLGFNYGFLDYYSGYHTK